MFQLNKKEFEILKSQFVTSSWGGARTITYSFTENGVAIFTSVLTSERAVQVNIQIMRTFSNLCKMYMSHANLKKLLILLRVWEGVSYVNILAINLNKPLEGKEKQI